MCCYKYVYNALYVNGTYLWVYVLSDINYNICVLVILINIHRIVRRGAVGAGVWVV